MMILNGLAGGEMFKKISMRRFIISLFMSVIAIFTISRSIDIQNIFGFDLRDHIVRSSYHMTGIKNTVTAVYLNYRYFDTIIETSVLMFTTIACVYISTFKREDK